MSRQFIYGQIARLDKANNAQVALPNPCPVPFGVATTACGRKDVINMKCDYGCYYIASHDEAYYELATAVARGVVLSE